MGVCSLKQLTTQELIKALAVMQSIQLVVIG